MLETVDIKIRGVGSATSLLNEYGIQRERDADKNCQCQWQQDPIHLRSAHLLASRLLTKRNSGADILQDLNYVFDPEGNIDEMTDNAQPTYQIVATECVAKKNCLNFNALFQNSLFVFGLKAQKSEPR